MDWMYKMNKAIEYIERNLENEININSLKSITNCSYDHFQKVFYYISGITLSEYIRRRRLTLAAFDLQNTDMKVIDIALKYGYDSPTAFTRAFKNLHKMSPKEAKDSTKIYTAFSPLSFQISMKGTEPIRYSIIEKESFKIIGTKLKTSIDENYHKEISKFWEDNTKKGLIPKLLEINDDDPKGILGVATGNWVSGTEFNYYIATSSKNKKLPSTMEKIEIPKSLWVIFECVGAMPNAMRDLHQRIITDWFFESGYEFTDLPDIEYYSSGDILSDDYKTEIWIPIKKE